MDTTFKQIGLNQRASGTIAVDDYSKLIESNATCEITIEDYSLLNEQKATFSFEVVDYLKLVGTNVVININSTLITCTDDYTPETSNEVTAENIKDALNTALTGFTVTRSGTTVTVEYDTAGVAGNSLPVSFYMPGTPTADLNYCAGLLKNTQFFSGGSEYATVVIDGNTLTAGTDFTAETNNDTTASNLATAITGLTGYTGSSATNTAIATFDTAGFAGNAKTCSITGRGLSISGATFANGYDHASITLEGDSALVQGTDFTAETDNETTATNIKTAINGSSTYVAESSENIITVYYLESGTGGNTKTITLDTDNQGFTADSALSGGLAETILDNSLSGATFQVPNKDNSQVQTDLQITSFDGDESGGSTKQIKITAEYSNDGTNWFTLHENLYNEIDPSLPFSKVLELANKGQLIRFKATLDGEAGDITFNLFCKIK